MDLVAVLWNPEASENQLHVEITWGQYNVELNRTLVFKVNRPLINSLILTCFEMKQSLLLTDPEFCCSEHFWSCHANILNI